MAKEDSKEKDKPTPSPVRGDFIAPPEIVDVDERTDALSETTTNEKEHKMEDKKIEQAEEHLKEAEGDLKIARDATEAAEHKIDEALQEKWEAEGKGKA